MLCQLLIRLYSLLFQAKLETKALKAKRPGFTDDRYNETSYYIENGECIILVLCIWLVSSSVLMCTIISTFSTKRIKFCEKKTNFFVGSKLLEVNTLLLSFNLFNRNYCIKEYLIEELLRVLEVLLNINTNF